MATDNANLLPIHTTQAACSHRQMLGQFSCFDGGKWCFDCELMIAHHEHETAARSAFVKLPDAPHQHAVDTCTPLNGGRELIFKCSNKACRSRTWGHTRASCIQKDFASRGHHHWGKPFEHTANFCSCIPCQWCVACMDVVWKQPHLGLL